MKKSTKKKAAKSTPKAASKRGGRKLDIAKFDERVLQAVKREGSRMAAIVRASRCPGPTYEVQVSRTRAALRRLRDAGSVACNQKTWIRLR